MHLSLRLPLLALVAAAPLAAQDHGDEFLVGYAVAVLEREFRVPHASVRASSGVLTVRARDFGDADRDRVRQVLARIPGVTRVDIVDADPESRTQPGEAEVRPRSASLLSWNPLLFEPLHADPRWPHFSASYQSYRGNDGLSDVGAASFGESLSLARFPTEGAGSFEVGVQAGVFAIFDLHSDSFDLVNADYTFAFAGAWRSGPLSALARVYHQSSHLGDEYLLRTQPERINLSYEVADLLVSWDVTDELRVYAGGGYVLHSETPLEHWLAQTGAEIFGAPFGGSAVRPLVAGDVQFREQSDWHGDVSARLGIEIADPGARARRLQVAFEYYRGSSPNGQFYEQDIELYGIGLHFYF